MNALLFCGLHVVLALTCLLPGLTSAEVVRGLYEGQVVVNSEQEGERLAAQGQALRQVLGKLSGVARVSGPVVDAAVAEPQRYLQQFSYRRSEDPSAPLALWASFEVAAVDALLREARLPVWSGQRPAVLVWLALASSESIELLTPDSAASAEPILPALNRRAWERGIPITYPLLDLEDRVRIQAADVWQLDTDKIAAASVRYGAGVALVGRVEATGIGAWIARWSMIESGSESQWTTQGLSAAATVPDALDEVANRLSAKYAVLSASDADGGDSIDVRVTGVRTLNDYARALDYLSGLDQISALVMRAARRDELRLSMQVRGGSEGLQRVTAFSDVLRVESTAQHDSALSLRLLP